MNVVVRDGWTKHVARAACAPELGAVAWHSGKQHLGPQVVRALLESGREWVDAALSDKAGLLSEWIDPAALSGARTAWTAGASDPVANNRVMQIASLQR